MIGLGSEAAPALGRQKKVGEHMANARHDPDDAAHRLFEVRSRMKMSQAAFAAHIGVSHRAYRNYEAGLREMSLSAFRGVVVACNLDAEWMLFGSAGRDASTR